MIKKELKGIDVDIFYEKLNNGLEIYLIPYKDRKNYYVEYGVKYGAKINQFISQETNKKIKTPYGVAHFLEHKMFEQEDGEDPFSFFSISGSEANASTSYDMTSYTVEGINNLEDNLDYLLNYVNSPYFTDENVEKEKGIIIEELNMYKDQPESELFDEGNKALFVRHPMRVDIGGTPNSVRKITKEILYSCYNTFYQPSNMFLVIAGNLDCDKVLKVIHNNKKLNSKNKTSDIRIINPKEPIEVKYKEKEIKIKNLVVPKFVLSFKSQIKKYEFEENYKYELSLSILLYILFGMSSDFREDAYNKELCSLLYSSSSIIDNLLIVEFLSESRKPYELKDKIIECLKNTKITKEDVERVKKVKISLEVIDSDKPYKMVNSIIKDLIDYNGVIYNKIELIKSIELKDIEEVRKDILCDNYSFVVGMPK